MEITTYLALCRDLKSYRSTTARKNALQTIAVLIIKTNKLCTSSPEVRNL